eukprot:6199985-Pleurochrysis_carterae.AAC.1
MNIACNSDLIPLLRPPNHQYSTYSCSPLYTAKLKYSRISFLAELIAALTCTSAFAIQPSQRCIRAPGLKCALFLLLNHETGSRCATMPRCDTARGGSSYINAGSRASKL